MALATVIEGATAGAKLLVGPDLDAVGSLGDPELDRVVARGARAELEAGGTGGSETNDWTYQGQNKCCRELHLYLEDGKLKCTAIVRMQNANIFVKNIHFFATLLEYVARELDVPLGEYTHWYVSHGGWGLPRAHAVRCHSLCFPSHNAPQSSPPGPGPVPTP